MRETLPNSGGRAVVWVWLAMGASMGAVAQTYVPPPPPLVVDPCAARPNPLIGLPSGKMPVCPPAVAKQLVPAPAGTVGGAAEKFPFPRVAAPAKTVEQFPFPGDAPVAPPAKGAAAVGAAKDFPYPGETASSPDAVPEGNTPRYMPDAPSGDAGASSSSSSSGPSDPQPAAGDDAAKAEEPPAAAKSGRRKLPKVSAQSVDERVSEDLEVAKFYTDHGNFLAAYLRSKDATKLAPEDPEGHFALGQSSAKLGKKDEAAVELTLYLKLDPAGTKRRAAEQALAGLQ